MYLSQWILITNIVETVQQNYRAQVTSNKFPGERVRRLVHPFMSFIWRCTYLLYAL